MNSLVIQIPEWSTAIQTYINFQDVFIHSVEDKCLCLDINFPFSFAKCDGNDINSDFVNWSEKYLGRSFACCPKALSGQSLNYVLHSVCALFGVIFFYCICKTSASSVCTLPACFLWMDLTSLLLLHPPFSFNGLRSLHILLTYYIATPGSAVL